MANVVNSKEQRKNALFEAILAFTKARAGKAWQSWREFQNPPPVRVMFAPPTPTPLQQAQQAYAKAQYQRAIEEGFKNWGNPPAATMAAIYAEAPEYAPIFKKYPFLLPAQSIAETSGGQPYDPIAKTGVTYPHNVQNWGIKAQKQGLYSPSGFEQNIRDSMTGIGGRTAEQGFSPNQIRTSGYYEPFRQSQNLQDFVTTYAPPGENDTEKYLRDIQNIMSVFDQAFKTQTSGVAYR